MAKSCARCEKTVYPIEELKCLDKVWHKQCFKCQVCQMTLNMRNYKGFNKDPYCEAHIPKAKATTVAETPEYKRMAENTKIQSNFKYHEDFEKAKGKFTQVADDPETRRIKANSKNISNVAYHGDLEKKANMEKLRNIGENGEEVAKSNDPSSCAVHQQQQQQHHQQHHHQQQQHQQQQHQHQQPPRSNPVQKTSQHDPHANSAYTARQSSTVIYTSDRGPVSNPPVRVGSIQDLDPVNDFYGSLASDHEQKGSTSEYYGRNYGMHPNEYQQQQQQQPKYPQSNYPYSSSHQQPPQQQQPQPQQQQQQQQPQQQQYNRSVSNGHQRSNPQMGYGNDYRSNNVPSVQQTQPARQQSRTSGRVYRAMYDYKAQDSDEVSFIDGDIIVDCTPIDDGWLTGVVKRTGQSGLLPANYVTPAI